MGKKVLKEEKLMHDELAEGHIPEELVIVCWEDITQSEHCTLKETIKLINFHSCGTIINTSGEQLDLQQTWTFDEDDKEKTPINPANLRISFPLGVIKKIYKYKLVKG